MEKKVTSPAIKGIVIALILIVYSLIIQYTGQAQNKSLSFISFVVLIVGIIWSCINYAKQLNANVTYGNVFADGFKVTAAVTALICIFSYLLFNVISPELKEEALRQIQTSLEKSKVSDEQMEKTLGFMRENFTVTTVGTQMLLFLITGVVASLIGAAVAKKNPEGPFVQQA
jgi:hypothetical protein